MYHPIEILVGFGVTDKEDVWLIEAELGEPAVTVRGGQNRVEDVFDTVVDDFDSRAIDVEITG